ncbi:MAG: hypothetical protein MPW14_17225 [Candidatus Manganitrophus sp.]|nr:MAG: hypothetical protein MPW14_17225 [Candidatus Manganitrophus sp.]
MERYRSWLALKRVTGVGNVLYRRLLDRFKTPDAIFAAGEEALQTVAGVSSTLPRRSAVFPRSIRWTVRLRSSMRWG